ncbi:hypothetical protein EUX98_g1685 [Antrodiella citrinella]|uniref:Uncharacterized protein n=1 Tax=Antrodiella citrinella TaxID=2447956 RepID=A0A4V3XJB5_9APHY|nr:hypothetical protein EUX98_g1685 [Antrodiella citrinella]
MCKDIMTQVSEAETKSDEKKRNIASDAAVFFLGGGAPTSCAFPVLRFWATSSKMTDPDKTGEMPKKMPAELCISDADYDAATADTGADGRACGIDGGDDNKR